MAVTTVPPHEVTHRASDATRRVGYLLAAGANALGIWIARNLLDWGWPRFLTDDFDELVPLITLSFAAGIAVNLLYVGYDADWFKSLGNLLTGAISFVVAIRTWQVFPFDFSTYAVDWSFLLRLFVVVAIVGTFAGMVVEVVKLARMRIGDSTS